MWHLEAFRSDDDSLFGEARLKLSSAQQVESLTGLDLSGPPGSWDLTYEQARTLLQVAGEPCTLDSIDTSGKLEYSVVVLTD